MPNPNCPHGVGKGCSKCFKCLILELVKKDRAEREAKLVAPVPPPRYDEIYAAGTEWLDSEDDKIYPHWACVDCGCSSDGFTTVTHPEGDFDVRCPKCDGCHVEESVEEALVRAASEKEDLEYKLEDLEKERNALKEQLAASERELERWRHGVPIEGDYVCPDSLKLVEAKRELEMYRHNGFGATVDGKYVCPHAFNADLMESALYDLATECNAHLLGPNNEETLCELKVALNAANCLLKGKR